MKAETCVIDIAGLGDRTRGTLRASAMRPRADEPLTATAVATSLPFGGARNAETANASPKQKTTFWIIFYKANAMPGIVSAARTASRTRVEAAVAEPRHWHPFVGLRCTQRGLNTRTAHE